MTERQLEKWDGKIVRIEKLYFPHSVKHEIIEGQIEIVKDECVVIRNGERKIKLHNAFYIDPQDGRAMKFYSWQNVKLILKIEEIAK